MDSRMLNVFHEDPFEGNFAKYEAESNFWSPNDDLQLTDTLNGILPIAPTDDSLLIHNREEDLQNRKNLLIYSDFVEQQLGDQDANVLNAQVYRAITDGEVEAAFEQQRQLSTIVEFDREDVGAGGLSDEEEDIQSQCSASTFRTRTDSSSIGDYESHSSDYEDDDADETVEDVAVKCLPTENKNVPALESSSERKSRTLSTNTIVSEVDAFGLNIDVNDFDLADFITKDDFAENLNACRMKQSQSLQSSKSQPAANVSVVLKAPVAKSLPKPISMNPKNPDSDDDSDSIIDVETVDVIDVDETGWSTKKLSGPAQVPEDLCYVDNVKADPSWCPKPTKPKTMAVSKEVRFYLYLFYLYIFINLFPIQLKTSAPVETQEAPAPASSKPKTANICLVPNKKQCDFLKRKMGGTSSTSKTSKTAAKKAHEVAKSSSNKQVQALGLGLGGKNLALLKQEREAALTTSAVEEPQVQTSSVVVPLSVPTATPAPKRKLNLEEYKQRRCGGVLIPKSKPTPPKQSKLDTSIKSVAPVAIAKPPSPQKAAIANIVNSLKCPTKEAATVPMDPITVAKNKVLRMLEMKRAQQLKIIDSRISAKVPRVTKLPPLKDIVKDTYCMETESPAQPVTAPSSNKLHPDYEEIIIVSVSCNTEITIPPNQLSKASPRSLLKSSVLLYNISNGQDANKNMNHSLIASIQSELVKKTCSTILPMLPSSNTGPAKDSKNKNVPHGEDMVIMHLPKDRVRKTLVSMATQTDLQPEFPLLTLPNLRKSRERSRRYYRKRRSQGSASGSNVSSSSSASSTDCSSLDSSRSRSRSNSIDQLRNLEVAATCGASSIGNGGYSSRSTHRHRSSVSSSSYSEAGKCERRQRRTSYNKRRSKNQKPSSFSSSGSENSDGELGHSPHRSLRRSRSRSKSDTRIPSNSCSSSNNNRRGFMDRNVSQPAVEERRIVYVGRIEQETSKEVLRRKFLAYGSIKQITIHYKENGMKYGFVTYERAQDAFTAIDTSPRDPQINMYDISFGGRRAFCRASYADLDNAGINNYHSYVFPKEAPAPKVQDDSFEAMLLNLKAKLSSGKPASATASETQPASVSTAQDHNPM
ncbi:hypothetical protein KR009_004772 [Drosophila setifemur]|nr:hypothetical protein KR009_004772 [Drosophila setifemur]